MTDYHTLIARLENGSGADRELDLAIGHLWPAPQPFSLSVKTLRDMKPALPHFVSSLDAALAFAEAVGFGPDHDLQFVRSRRFEHLHQVRIGIETCVEDIDETGPHGIGEHGDAARALIISVLRALSALQEQDQ
jgi:hypothetical protein